MSEQSKSFQELISDVPEGVFKLAPGLTSEEMLPIFFNENALMESPVKVYRLQGTKVRLYYVFDDHGQPMFYTSVTTMIKFTMPTSPHLIKWMADMGYEESKVYAQERADYGTFMHIEIATLLIARKYDLDTLPDRLKGYAEVEKLPASFVAHADELKKDILAFAQFMIDCDVEPLAVEVVLPHPDGYAGAVDLVCNMTIEETGYHGEHYKTGAQAGQPKKTKASKRIKAIVDFKSGRKGFYEEHEVQVEAYRRMWEHNFPEHKIDRVYNWAPKDWRSAPTYHLKDQTESKSREKLDHLVRIARIENETWDKSVTVIRGEIDIARGLHDNFIDLSFSELVKKKNGDKDPEGKSIDPRLT